ncbi:MAG TPA: trypsin-like peptidase domain-containing protein [Bacilli bacterium]|nr:trypsin-like peptidase domain-containing protein [Bacilli bacterium]
MFIKAIENNLDCVKAISTAYKTPSSDEVISSMFSFIVINEEGWVLTTKSVANNIVFADKIHTDYEKVRQELLENKIPPKKIFKKYKLNDDSIMIFKNVFLNTIASWTNLKIFAHDTLDLALIKFDDPKDLVCSKFPIFAKEDAKQGEMLCRLGYPYSDFKAFKYDHSKKDIVLNEIVDGNLQIFPSEGMLTRYLLDSNKNLTLFEISNYSFIGQIGGPIINKNGEIVGLLLGNAFKDAEIDINAKVKRGNKEVEIKQNNFIPLSICLNVTEIKKFLDENKVKYKTK